MTSNTAPRVKALTWKRTEDGYVSKDGRFTILKHTGRAWTRGPFRNWWTVKDTETGLGRVELPSLVEAKAWAAEQVEGGSNA